MINFNPTVIDAIISLFPNAQVVVVGDNVNYTVTWNSPSTAPVTNEQINAELIKLQSEVPLAQCKEKAMALLQQTDWAVTADVGDPLSTPYLVNQADFKAYRNSIRALAVNPVANPVFPEQPTEQWSN